MSSDSFPVAETQVVNLEGLELKLRLLRLEEREEESLVVRPSSKRRRW